MANTSTTANTNQWYHRPAQISPVMTSSGGGHPASMYFLNDSSAPSPVPAAAAGMTNHHQHHHHQQHKQHDFVDYQYSNNNINSNDNYKYLAPRVAHPSNNTNSIHMQYNYNWSNTPISSASHHPAAPSNTAVYTTNNTTCSTSIPFVRILSPDHCLNHHHHHQCAAIATEAPLHNHRLPPLDNDSIVQPEDLPLITDYFRFLMSQFEPCKFQELDRTARGGKRESIEIGFAGLQCRHCNVNSNHSDDSKTNQHQVETSSKARTVKVVRGRKFFWSNVDCLANSISEFSSHLTRCRSCPPEIKVMMGELKEVHPMQAAKVSKGSQKAFLRRVWTRIHHGSCENDDDDDEDDDDAMNGDDVVACSSQIMIPSRSDHYHRNRLLLSKVTLMDKNDNDTLSWSALDRLLHRNIEVFEANDQDVQESEMTPNPVLLGQVGLRCIHCAVSTRTPSSSGSSTECNNSIVANHNDSSSALQYCSFAKKRKAEVTTANTTTCNTQKQNTVYPLSASDIFDAVEDLRCHFECCPCIPTKVFGKLIRASKSSISASACPSVPERQLMYGTNMLGKKLKIRECAEGIRYHGDRDL